MTYTPERQESDRSFLVGVNYGRDTERARWIAAVKQVKNDYIFGTDDKLDELLRRMTGE